MGPGGIIRPRSESAQTAASWQLTGNRERPMQDTFYAHGKVEDLAPVIPDEVGCVGDLARTPVGERANVAVR